MNPDFYYILALCFVSFLIGYFVPIIFNKINVKKPENVKKVRKPVKKEIDIPTPVPKVSHSIINDKISIKNNLKSEHETVNIDDIIPGQVRAKKTFDGKSPYNN